MKKVIALLGVVMFSASAFALNAQAPAGNKTCDAQKAAFEKYAAEQKTSFVEQYILINLSDPMEQMTDEQAQPLAACYATFRVKGAAFLKFVRDNAEIFPGDIQKREANKLYAFADRVERLSEKAEFDRVVAMGNDSFVIQHILSNMADPMKNMNDEQARAKAQAYASYAVRGQSLVDFVIDHKNDYTMDVEIDLENFADRVERLSK